ncbi:hypothetical protein QTP86_015599 [Hemibagrus guttatus]|nr:hypothetical protein QTP86_015599 [Hemibagrus guttatus]
MLCATAQNDQMELEDNGFLRADLDEWQAEDSIFMEVKKKKEKVIAAPDYESVDNSGDEGSALEKKEAEVSPDLKTIPALPKETTYLYARFNKITKITNKDFADVGTLKRIDLTDNLISEIEDGAFSRLDQLEELTLAGNRLTKLPMLPPQLTSLNANHNRLKTKGIRSTVLKKLRKLAYLYIGDNELEAIPPLPESLHVVHLHNNNITTMTDETFCKGNDTHYIRYNMQEVRLDGNPIILAQHPNSFICLRSLPIGLYK